MRKLISFFGLSLSSLILPLSAASLVNPQDVEQKRHCNKPDPNISTQCCCTFDLGKLFAYTVPSDSPLISLSIVADLNTTVYDAEFGFYVPLFTVGLSNNITRIDEATFLIKNKGVYQITYSISNDATEVSPIFGIELADSNGANVIPGSLLAFSGAGPSEVLETLSLLVYIPEDNTAIRIAETALGAGGSSVRLAAGDDSIADVAVLTIVQIPH